MHQFFHLSFCGSNHLRIAVPGVHDRNAGKTINIVAAMDISYDGTAGLIHDDRCNRLQETGDNVIFVLLECIRDQFLKRLNRDDMDHSPKMEVPSL